MRHQVLVGLVFLSFGFGATGEDMDISSGSILTADDLQPVLEVISRLAPVTLNKQQRLPGLVSVCFLYNQAFETLNSALANFRGSATWTLLSRPPLVCLAVIPAESALRAHRIDSVAKLRNFIRPDVKSLASYLEQQLRVSGNPSKGIKVREESVDSTNLSVLHAPGGPALLVSDPNRYIASGFHSTSARDLTVDFWMSDRELFELYADLEQASTERGSRGLPLLRRVAEATHENLIVLPAEVPILKLECNVMAGVSKRLRGAMQRVIQICDMAEANDLGIVVIGG